MLIDSTQQPFRLYGCALNRDTPKESGEEKHLRYYWTPKTRWLQELNSTPQESVWGLTNHGHLSGVSSPFLYTVLYMEKKSSHHVLLCLLQHLNSYPLRIAVSVPSMIWASPWCKGSSSATSPGLGIWSVCSAGCADRVSAGSRVAHFNSWMACWDSIYIVQWLSTFAFPLRNMDTIWHNYICIEGIPPIPQMMTLHTYGSGGP